MNNHEPRCKADLKKNIINKDVYERELQLCKNLSLKNGGKCCWGVCSNCGVIPLLHKLYKGELLEDPKLIKELKNKIIS